MFTKTVLGLAVAACVGPALASDHHIHAAHHRLHDKRVGGLTTHWTTTTKWVTATLVLDESTTSTHLPSSGGIFYAQGTSRSHRPHSHRKSKSSSASASSSSSSSSSTSTSSIVEATSTSTPPAAAPTTFVTSPAPVVSTPAASDVANVLPVTVPVSVAPVVQVSVAVAPTPQPAPAPAVSSGSKKRGLAYNDAGLLPGFVGSGSKVSWGYNWGQWNDLGLSGVEFVPMLWGTSKGFPGTWQANAAAAIAAGSGHLLGFNEPDNAGQSDMSPGDAAAAHKQYMNQFSGQARIGSPSVTNSGAGGQGLDWLKQFLGACAGGCAVDFCPIHWYSPPDPASFLQHVKDAYAVCGKPIWITEFAPSGSDAEIQSFLTTVLAALDSDEYSFVERYSYFMVGPGSLISSGTSLSSYGQLFAYS